MILLKLKDILFKYLLLIKKNLNHITLVDIDNNKKICTLVTRWGKGILRLDLHKLIADEEMISSFAAEDAATIGYYYGKNYKEMLKKGSGYIARYSLVAKDPRQCRIISINRKREINFFINGKYLTMPPIEIIKKKSLIRKFHSLQASYIGIQAGLISNNKNDFNAQVRLQTVKNVDI